MGGCIRCDAHLQGSFSASDGTLRIVGWRQQKAAASDRLPEHKLAAMKRRNVGAEQNVLTIDVSSVLGWQYEKSAFCNWTLQDSDVDQGTISKMGECLTKLAQQNALCVESVL